uniref:Uncharacterized protein n=1 Tax=Ciona savignyi TaxID=51511 RepID=H2Y8S8_CIOSA
MASTNSNRNLINLYVDSTQPECDTVLLPDNSIFCSGPLTQVDILCQQEAPQKMTEVVIDAGNTPFDHHKPISHNIEEQAQKEDLFLLNSNNNAAGIDNETPLTNGFRDEFSDLSKSRSGIMSDMNIVIEADVHGNTQKPSRNVEGKETESMKQSNVVKDGNPAPNKAKVKIHDEDVIHEESIYPPQPRGP